MNSKSDQQVAIVKNLQPLTQEQNFISTRGTDRQVPLGSVVTFSGEPTSK